MTKTTPRREFIKQAVAGVAGAAMLHRFSADSAGKENDRMLPIIDTHQHLWDLKRFKLPWLGDAPEVLSRSYVTSDFLEATQGLNVVKAVYMEVDVDPSQQVAEAEYVFSLSRSDDYPTAGAVISGRPNSEGFADYVKQFRNSPYFKGVRQVLHVPDAMPGLCLQKQFVQSVRLLGEMGKSFDLCMRPTELKDGLELARKCPDTRLILDHCGNADPKAFMAQPPQKPDHDPQQWKDDLAQVAEAPNVICKISGIVARVPGKEWDAGMLAPIINHCLDVFGPERVVFGGDWPVCLLGSSYRGWVEALKEVISNRPESEQRRLLHDNAVKFYSLS